MHFTRSGLHRFPIANNRCLWYTETEKEGKTVKIAICDDSKDFLCQVGAMLKNWLQAPENMTTAFFTDSNVGAGQKTIMTLMTMEETEKGDEISFCIDIYDFGQEELLYAGTETFTLTVK